MAIDIALTRLLLERSLSISFRRRVDAVANGAGRQRHRIVHDRARGQVPALLHRDVARIIRRGIGGAILIGVVRLIDVLLLLLDRDLNILNACLDLGVVNRDNSDTACGVGRQVGSSRGNACGGPKVGAAVKEAVGVAVWVFSLF